jgi:hypothetical protein
MAITSVKFVSKKWSKNAQGETYTVIYQTESDERDEEPRASYVAVGIEYGEPYPTDDTLVCTGIESDPGEPLKGKGNVWRLTYTFGKPTVDKSTQQDDCQEPGVTNPLLYIAELSGSCIRVQKNLSKDRKGKPFQNKAGVPFKGFLVVEEGRNTLKATKNHSAATFDPDKATKYIDAINKDKFLGRPPGTVRFIGAP